MPTLAHDSNLDFRKSWINNILPIFLKLWWFSRLILFKFFKKIIKSQIKVEINKAFAFSCFYKYIHTRFQVFNFLAFSSKLLAFGFSFPICTLKTSIIFPMLNRTVIKFSKKAFEIWQTNSPCLNDKVYIICICINVFFKPFLEKSIIFWKHFCKAR